VKKDFVMPILVMGVICLIVSGALAFVNGVTEPVIGAAAAQRAEEAMSAIIPDATGFNQLARSRLPDGLPSSIREVHESENGVGYIFIVSVNGFGGELRVICGIGPDGNLIRAETLQHSETRGIGTIVEQASFLNQFTGKDSRLDGVSAVTGATISSRAFTNAVRDAFAAFEIVREVR
jgi:electron transport complex protein RnfG